jgi:hypothetical protein
MSIHFISGKPGGGKSLFAVMCVLDELRLSRRNIVTNLPLNIGNVAHYLHQQYGDSLQAARRITLLDEKQSFNWWLYYGQGLKLEARREIDINDGDRKVARKSVVDYTARGESVGVLYVIDEAHKFHSARAWSTHGEDGFYYCSEHRRLGDDVLLVTQAIGNVDKQLRSIAQDFTYMRNFYKERYGIFRSFSCFARRTYGEPATGQPGQLCLESKRFKIDVAGVCSCYDTNASVSIVGRTGGDTQEKQKGLPLALLFALIFFAVVGGAVGLRLFMSNASTFVLGGVQKNVARTLGLPQTNSAARLPSPATRVDDVPRPGHFDGAATNIWMSGFITNISRGGFTICLTDGQMLWSRSGEVSLFTPQGVRWLGIWYPAIKNPSRYLTNSVPIALPLADGLGTRIEKVYDVRVHASWGDYQKKMRDTQLFRPAAAEAATPSPPAAY